jgi:transcription elongation GreA/GreB family factor
MQKKVIEELRQSKQNIMLRLEEIEEALDELMDSKNEESLVAYQDLVNSKTHLEQALGQVESRIQQAVRSTSKSKQVTVEVEGLRKSFSIADPKFANPRAGAISSKSPMARALDGRKEGETFNFSTPTGLKTCKLISII